MLQNTRADGHEPYKLVFSKLRHSADIPPHEIERMSGANSLAWCATPWDDPGRMMKLSNADKLIQVLEDGPLEFKEAQKRSGLVPSSFYDAFSENWKKRTRSQARQPLFPSPKRGRKLSPKSIPMSFHVGCQQVVNVKALLGLRHSIKTI